MCMQPLQPIISNSAVILTGKWHPPCLVCWSGQATSGDRPVALAATGMQPTSTTDQWWKVVSRCTNDLRG
jgi:hypothetical protein